MICLQEDFEEWDIILRSHALFSPTDHLIEEFKTAYLDFRFMDAFKCLILLKVLDENTTQLYHFLRVLYSQAETFTYLVADLQVLRDLIKDLYRAEVYRLPDKKVSPQQILQYFLNVKVTVENEVADSHLTVVDGFQPRLYNLMSDLEVLIREIAQNSTMPTRMIKTLEKIQKKLKMIELTLKVIGNCLMLYTSEYMKSTYAINAFDDPLTIE